MFKPRVLFGCRQEDIGSPEFKKELNWLEIEECIEALQKGCTCGCRGASAGRTQGVRRQCEMPDAGAECARADGKICQDCLDLLDGGAVAADCDCCDDSEFWAQVRERRKALGELECECGKFHDEITAPCGKACVHRLATRGGFSLRIW